MIRDIDGFDGHDKVLFVGPQVLGVPAVIALHRAIDGRSGGGVRFRSYPSDEHAVADALRLSRTMSYKNVLAGVPIGGGKAALIGDPRTDKTEEVLLRLGRLIESLGGAYIAGPDMGTSSADMAVIARATGHVIGVPGQGQDTSGPTAIGVLHGIRAVARRVLGASALAGVTIALQGLGSVGLRLCRLLAADSARLVVADIADAAVLDAAAATGAEKASPEEILSAPADILVPCAVGGVLDEHTIPRLRVRAICGPANNQLATPRDAGRLQERGIVFAPDYVVSSGGSISAAVELGLTPPAELEERLADIGATLTEVLRTADAHAITPDAAAQRLAETRLAASASPLPRRSARETPESGQS